MKRILVITAKKKVVKQGFNSRIKKKKKSNR